MSRIESGRWANVATSSRAAPVGVTMFLIEREKPAGDLKITVGFGGLQQELFSLGPSTRWPQQIGQGKKDRRLSRLSLVQ